jgi:hypothetical protein
VEESLKKTATLVADHRKRPLPRDYRPGETKGSVRGWLMGTT